MEVKTEVEKRNTEPERQQKQESFHVLAVDDSLIDRKLLEKLLKISSYQVTCVDSGDKALEYLGLIDNLQTNASTPSMEEGSRVNLIMTDYCMPGMTGYDLLKRLKGSSWKDVPVVVMSSEDVPSRVTMCLEGGAEDFLLKPVRLTDLEKLQPHLLKPVNHSCANNDNKMNNENNVYKSSNSNSNSNNNITTNNNTDAAAALGSKRKAMSPLEAPDRRPKMKETVALLV